MSRLARVLVPVLISLALIPRFTEARAWFGHSREVSTSREDFGESPFVSCLKTTDDKTQRLPAFGYTYASYASSNLGPDDCADFVSKVKSNGFKMITFTPSYKVSHTGSGRATKLKIDDSTQPSEAQKFECEQTALRQGLVLSFKPHLDPSNMPRAGLDFDPSQVNYFETLIKPQIDRMAGHAASAECKNCRFALYVGSELATSQAKHAQGWVKLLQQTRKYIESKGLKNRVELTDDVMFDAYNYAGADGNKALGAYFSGLDSISISQYTQLDVNGRTPEGVAKALNDHEQRFRAFLKRTGVEAVDQKPVNLGEFGIGSGGLKSPWKYGSKLSTQDEDTRIGIEGAIRYIEGKKDSSTGPMQWVNLWTVGPEYDIMNFVKWSNEESKRFDVADSVLRYNKSCR